MGAWVHACMHTSSDGWTSEEVGRTDPCWRAFVLGLRPRVTVALVRRLVLCTHPRWTGPTMSVESTKLLQTAARKLERAQGGDSLGLVDGPPVRPMRDKDRVGQQSAHESPRRTEESQSRERALTFSASGGFGDRLRRDGASLSRRPGCCRRGRRERGSATETGARPRPSMQD